MDVEVGVAAALADAVERALDLAAALAHGRQRVGDGVLGVVVGVDAEVCARHDLHHVGDDALDLVRKRAAVGVAQHHPAGAGFVRGPGDGQRIVAVALVAVEEVLAVEHGFAAARDHGLDAFGDALEVLLVRDAERDAHVIVPTPWRRGRCCRQRESSTAWKPVSFETERPARLIMPKAVKLARF